MATRHIKVRQEWWQNAVMYQIYPRSFADSDGDGVGNLAGITHRMQYLAQLGVDALWLSPITGSANKDWGYDVTDYFGVHPDLGTLADADRLIRSAHHHGIKVLLDLVPNHTSDEHPWFVNAKGSRSSAYRDFYVWADAGKDGGPPNNWRSSFGGSAWTHDEATGQYYLHNFLSSQPDLNWWNPAVRHEFERIMRFWYDRGVDGFRIDAAHMIVKDRHLRDNPISFLGTQPKVYNSNQPGLHTVIGDWRKLAEAYSPAKVLLGETYVFNMEQLAAFYAHGEGLQMGFHFAFSHARFTAIDLRQHAEELYSAFKQGEMPVWTGSNHDMSRMATRWAKGDDRKHRLALMMLLTLQGTAVMYYGDELGMGDVRVPYGQIKDPVTKNFWPIYGGRDRARTPMPWDASKQGGFTAPAATPWLPLSDVSKLSVAAQERDPLSTLHFTRHLLEFRKRFADLGHGAYAGLPSAKKVWMYQRGKSFVVALNFSNHEQTINCQGELILSTQRQDGERLAGEVKLHPWEGIVVRIK